MAPSAALNIGPATTDKHHMRTFAAAAAGLLGILALISAVTGIGDDGITCKEIGGQYSTMELCRYDDTGKWSIAADHVIQWRQHRRTSDVTAN